MTTWRRLIALLALVLAAALPATALAATAPGVDDHLALQARDVPALTPATARAGAARAALVAALRAGGATVSPTRVDAAAYRSDDGRTMLEAQAFAFADASSARRALDAWQKAQHGAGVATSSVSLGAGARVTARRAGGVARVEILVRVGATLGLVRLRDRGTLPAVRDVAIGYARAASGRLAAYAARTVSDRLADGIAADGSIPTATLLQLAAQAYGPIPGVRLPPGRAGRPPLDGTVLLERLVAAADRFTPAQRRALEGVLARPAGGARAAARRMPREAGTCPLFPDDNPLLVAESAQATAYRDAIARSISTVSLTPTWTVCVFRVEPQLGLVNAQTLQWSTEATTPPGSAGFLDSARYFGLASNMCYVQLFPRYFASTPQNQAHQLAHEMYHCLHKEWNHGSWLESDANPPWAEESLATWTAQSFAPGTLRADVARCPGSSTGAGTSSGPRRSSSAPTRRGASSASSSRPQAPARSGTASCRSGRRGPTRRAIFEAAVGSQRDEILDTWGAAHFGQASFPSPWLQRLPFTVPDTAGPEAARTPVYLSAGLTTLRPTVGYRADTWVLKSPVAPLVNVMMSGHGRVTDGATDWVHPASQWVCFGGRCTCPPRTHANASMPDFATIGASLYAGLRRRRATRRR